MIQVFGFTSETVVVAVQKEVLVKSILAVLVLAIVILVLIGPSPAMAAVYSTNFSSSVSTVVVSASSNLVSSAWLAIEQVVGSVIGLFVPPPPEKRKDPPPPPPKPATENTTWGEIKARWK